MHRYLGGARFGASPWGGGGFAVSILGREKFFKEKIRFQKKVKTMRSYRLQVHDENEGMLAPGKHFRKKIRFQKKVKTMRSYRLQVHNENQELLRDG